MADSASPEETGVGCGTALVAWLLLGLVDRRGMGMIHRPMHLASLCLTRSRPMAAIGIPPRRGRQLLPRPSPILTHNVSGGRASEEPRRPPRLYQQDRLPSSDCSRSEDGEPRAPRSRMLDAGLICYWCFVTPPCVGWNNNAVCWSTAAEVRIAHCAGLLRAPRQHDELIIARLCDTPRCHQIMDYVSTASQTSDANDYLALCAGGVRKRRCACNKSGCSRTARDVEIPTPTSLFLPILLRLYEVSLAHLLLPVMPQFSKDDSRIQASYQ